MALEVMPTELPDVLLLKPQLFSDARGFFFESYNTRAFVAAIGLDVKFVQDNQSRSAQHVLRGLHYQLPPAAQGKLVRVISGEIFDVAVDLRQSSPTFGRWTGQALSAENRLQIWIPAGFAHGFLTVSESAEVLYKTTDYYDPACERTLSWNDPELQIAWPLQEKPLLSPKDNQGAQFNMAEKF